MTIEKHVCQCSVSASDNRLDSKLLKSFIPTERHHTQVQCSTLMIDPIPNFSVFDKGHVSLAENIISRLVEASLDDTLASLAKLRCDSMALDDMSFCEYIARRTFATRKDTRTCVLPPSYQTNPSLYFTANIQPSISTKTIVKNIETGTDLDPEHKVAWWREDIGLCRHHENWHISYPYYVPVKDRQGELFAYMHQQMVGRYDFERLGVGLDRVRAFGPGYCWDETLTEGYNPHLKNYSARPRNIKVDSLTRRDTRRIINDEIIRNKDIIFTSLAKGWLETEDGTQMEITMNRLGCTVECNKGSVNNKMYGNLHNDGHLLLGYMIDPDGRFKFNPGVMIANSTATRDPVFFRWHKFIDSIFEAHRTDLPEYNLNDLVFSAIELISVEVKCEEGCDDNQFLTYMEKSVHNVYNINRGSDKGNDAVKVESTALNHVPFSYCIKLRNNTKQAVQVVVRIFISPVSDIPLEEWRNMFVELDKFVQRVDPGDDTITRYDVDSSVVLPPTSTVEDIRSGNVKPNVTPICGCGWPLKLLIPRGTNKGMKVKLFAIATNWEDDRTDPTSDLSGSVSYCGKSGEKYPDRRAMGFPFDRTTGYSDVEDLVKNVPNSFVTDAKIVFMEEEVIHNVSEDAASETFEPATRDAQTSPRNNFEFVLV